MGREGHFLLGTIYLILKCDGCLLGVGLGLEVGVVEVLEVVGVVVDLLADGVALIGLQG